MPFRKNSTVWLVPIIVLSLAIRLPVINFGLVYDDWNLFNTILPSYASFLDVFRLEINPQTPGYYYRPVSLLIAVILRSFFGTEPFVYHLVSLIVHGINVALVYFFTKSLFSTHQARGSISLITALLFSVFPVHAEVTAWISGYLELWLFFFSLLTLINTLKYNSEPQKRRNLILAYLFFFLAVFTKETGVVLFFMIVTYDILFVKFSEGHLLKTFLKKRVIIWLGFFAIILLYGLLRRWQMGSLNLGLEKYEFAPLDLLRSFGFYLSLLLFPFKTHSYMTEIPFGHLTLIYTFLFFSLLVISVKLKFQVKKQVVFLLCYFLFSLLPSLSVVAGSVSVTPLAERYLYLPSLAFCILLSLFIHRLFSLKPVMMIVVVLVVLIFYAARSVGSIRIWKNETSFWQGALRQNPKHPEPYAALGQVFLLQDDYPQAIVSLNKALEVYPNARPYPERLSRIYYNLGLAHELKKNFLEAEKNYLKSIEVLPRDMSYFHLGLVYKTLAAHTTSENAYIQQAIAAFHSALKLAPEKNKTLYFLSEAYRQNNETEKAAALLRKIIESPLKDEWYERAWKSLNSQGHL